MKTAEGAKINDSPATTAGESLVSVLRGAAAEREREPLYRFLVSGEAEGPQETLTAGELQDAAQRIASGLQANGVVLGDRVAIACSSPLEFAQAFFGCQWAGAVAVPVYPPRTRSGAATLSAILDDAKPAVLIGDVDSLNAARGFSPGCALMGCGELLEGRAAAEPATGDTAFLQYTSGSTSSPRGVVVSQNAVAACLRNIREALGAPAGSRGVCWLPLSHDLGLTGSFLLSLFAGYEMILMTPQAFAESPVRWLRAISAFRAWGTSAPNFALAQCTRMIRKQQAAGLDLSCLECLLCGAEPVDAEVLDQFAHRFAPQGLRRESLRPCYGLAEATLMVSMTPPGGPRMGATGRVSCGAARPGEQIAIVDAESLCEAAEGATGEIWFHGPAVADGYFGWSKDANDAVFRATLQGSETPFLRTGDLGTMIAGELFVTGRLKDVIIVRGRNYDAHDVERAARSAHPDLAGVRMAAFDDTDAGLVVMLEAAPGVAAGAHAGIVREVRARIGAEMGLRPERVLVATPKSIPITTSGKVQRAKTARLYREGTIEILFREQAGEDGGADASGLIEKTLLHEIRLAARLGDRDRISRQARLSEIGVDSLGLLQLGTTLRAQAGRDVRVDDDPSVEDLLARFRLGSEGVTESDVFAPIHEFTVRLKAAGAHPFYLPFTDWDGVHATLDGRRVLILSAFDYLGLSREARVREAAAQAARAQGTSRSGARVHAGTSPETLELEAKLAWFLGREDAVVCTTGYQAVAGLVSAFGNPRSTLVVDEEVHASVLDGAAIAHCRLARFRHNDAADLDRVLEGLGGAALVMVEGLYSNSGDVSPLKDIAAVCRRRGARLALDDAHGLGVLGPTGRGAEEHHGSIGVCDLLAGTFSKSLASTGGWIAGSRDAMDYARYHARTVLFTAGISPPSLAAASAALDVLVEQPELVARSRRNAEVLRGEMVRLGVPFRGECGPVMRIAAAGEERCVRLCGELLRRGVYVNPVLHPSTARGDEMLRICVSAAHDPNELRHAVAMLADVIREAH